MWSVSHLVETDIGGKGHRPLKGIRLLRRYKNYTVQVKIIMAENKN
jgi:hypothetical protein